MTYFVIRRIKKKFNFHIFYACKQKSKKFNSFQFLDAFLVSITHQKLFKQCKRFVFSTFQIKTVNFSPQEKYTTVSLDSHFRPSRIFIFFHTFPPTKNCFQTENSELRKNIWSHFSRPEIDTTGTRDVEGCKMKNAHNMENLFVKFEEKGGIADKGYGSKPDIEKGLAAHVLSIFFYEGSSFSVLFATPFPHVPISLYWFHK